MSDTKWSEGLNIPQESKEAAQEYKADNHQNALLGDSSTSEGDSKNSGGDGSDWSERLNIPQESKEAAQEYKADDRQNALLETLESDSKKK